jgi:hypothetical protein
LLIVVVSLIASSGGSDDPTGGAAVPGPATTETGYMASFSSICNKAPAEMDLEMAGSYECDTLLSYRSTRAGRPGTLTRLCCFGLPPVQIF